MAVVQQPAHGRPAQRRHMSCLPPAGPSKDAQERTAARQDAQQAGGGGGVPVGVDKSRSDLNNEAPHRIRDPAIDSDPLRHVPAHALDQPVAQDRSPSPHVIARKDIHTARAHWGSHQLGG